MAKGRATRRRKRLSSINDVNFFTEKTSGTESEILDISYDLDRISSPLASSLCSRIRNLNLQFKRLVDERDEIQQQFTSECSNSLRLALEQLQELIEHVAKVDKSLIFWYRSGTPLRLALKTLKPIGFDHDAGTIMLKKGNGIRQKADLVSQSFDQCSSICFSALGDVQSLQLKTTDFVTSGIGAALEEAEDLKRDNIRKQEGLQLDISRKEIDMARVRVEAASAETMADDLRRQKQAANKASDRSAAVGIAGGVGAVLLGIGCLLCPPAGAVAAGIGAFSAGAVGVSSAVVASEHSSDARRLGSEESSFRWRVTALEDEISEFRSEIGMLEMSKDDYDRATEAINTLEHQCELLRNQTDVFLKDLNVARTFVSQGVIKTQTIASTLHRCEYARTRSDFVDRINSVLEDLRRGSGNRLTASEETLDLLQSQLAPLQKNANRVTGILVKAFLS